MSTTSSSSSSSSSGTSATSSEFSALVAPIASPLGGWSCDYFYYLTIFTFLAGVVICAQSIFVVATATGPKATRSGLLWSGVGIGVALIPIALSYFNARILFSMCAASIGKDKRGV